MNRGPVFLMFVFLTMSAISPVMGQSNASAADTVVPSLVNYSGKAIDAQGKPVTGIAGVTFAIYKDETDGGPLWMETQNVQADARGNFSVQLGATKPGGLTLELFQSGEARWLGVRINGGEEQPRVLLLSLPYALKAADAQTLGGLPPSAFVLASPVNNSAANSCANISSPAAQGSSTSQPSSNVGGSGTQKLPSSLDRQQR
jgi:trimeric autotransporter adhesin